MDQSAKWREGEASGSVTKLCILCYLFNFKLIPSLWIFDYKGYSWKRFFLKKKNTKHLTDMWNVDDIVKNRWRWVPNYTGCWGWILIDEEAASDLVKMLVHVPPQKKKKACTNLVFTRAMVTIGWAEKVGEKRKKCGWLLCDYVKRALFICFLEYVYRYFFWYMIIYSGILHG